MTVPHGGSWLQGTQDTSFPSPSHPTSPQTLPRTASGWKGQRRWRHPQDLAALVPLPSKGHSETPAWSGGGGARERATGGRRWPWAQARDHAHRLWLQQRILPGPSPDSHMASSHKGRQKINAGRQQKTHLENINEE